MLWLRQWISSIMVHMDDLVLTLHLLMTMFVHAGWARAFGDRGYVDGLPWLPINVKRHTGPYGKLCSKHPAFIFSFYLLSEQFFKRLSCPQWLQPTPKAGRGYISCISEEMTPQQMMQDGINKLQMEFVSIKWVHMFKNGSSLTGNELKALEQEFESKILVLQRQVALKAWERWKNSIETLRYTLSMREVIEEWLKWTFVVYTLKE